MALRSTPSSSAQRSKGAAIGRVRVGRDYLRTAPDAAAEYVAVKRRLALRYRDDRRGYTDAKGPFLWEVIRRADEWAQAQGWQSGPTDA